MSQWLDAPSSSDLMPAPNSPSPILGITITASRWSRGNLLFPTQLELLFDRVVISKRRLFGKTERFIPIQAVASVSLHTGVFFAGVVIESFGGSEDIVGLGFHTRDLTFFCDAFQSRLSSLTTRWAYGSPLSGSTKLCPFCAETIQNAAIKCRYCGETLLR